MVIVVWNAHGLSMTLAHARRMYVKKFAEYRERMAEEGAPTIVLAGFDALEARRVANYEGERRCVGEWELMPDARTCVSDNWLSIVDAY